MNRDRLAYLVAVLILITFLAGCGTPATPTASAPAAQVGCHRSAALARSPHRRLPHCLLVVLPKDATITPHVVRPIYLCAQDEHGSQRSARSDRLRHGLQHPHAIDGIDLVTVSHEHSDHNAVSLAAGSPIVLNGLAGNDWAKIDQTVKGVRVRTVGVYHDDTQGSQRGKNAIFVFDVDGLRLAHLGDLGHTLSPEQIKDIGPVDVILIPVGGFYTVDGKAATEVVNQLNPKIVIPMHYKTADLSPSLAGRIGPGG